MSDTTAEELNEAYELADALQAENAELRELCKDMYENPYALSECWECPHCGNGCISNCYYHDRLRELGVIK